MTIHFYYDFKQDLIEKLKEDYEEELKERKERLRKQKQLDEAEQKILSYFTTIKNGLNEVFEVSDGFVDYKEGGDYIVKFALGKNSLKFIRKENSIEISEKFYIKEADIVESKILANIVPGKKKCLLKKVGELHTGNHFDTNTINFYMRQVFSQYTENK